MAPIKEAKKIGNEISHNLFSLKARPVKNIPPEREERVKRYGPKRKAML